MSRTPENASVHMLHVVVMPRSPVDHESGARVVRVIEAGANGAGPGPVGIADAAGAGPATAAGATRRRRLCPRGAYFTSTSVSASSPNTLIGTVFIRSDHTDCCARCHSGIVGMSAASICSASW
jgi:hypothetical protein